MSRSLSSSQARGSGKLDRLCFSFTFMLMFLKFGMQFLFAGVGRFRNWVCDIDEGSCIIV